METFKDIIKWNIANPDSLKNQLAKLFNEDPNAALRWQVAHEQIVIFNEWKCTMRFNMYKADDSIHIALVHHETAEPIATCTVCLKQPDLDEDMILVKDYAENTSMTISLIEAGVIFPESLIGLGSGYVFIYGYKLKL